MGRFRHRLGVVFITGGVHASLGRSLVDGIKPLHTEPIRENEAPTDNSNSLVACGDFLQLFSSLLSRARAEVLDPKEEARGHASAFVSRPPVVPTRLEITAMVRHPLRDVDRHLSQRSIE